MKGILLDTNACAAFKRGDSNAVAMQDGYAVFSFDARFGEMEGLIAGTCLDDFLP